MQRFSLILALLFLAFTSASARSATPERRRWPSTSTPLARPAPSGDISVHDPSGITYENSSSLYYAFGTGILRGEILASHISTDGYAWIRGPPPFTQAPAWVKTHVPMWRMTFWAPDLIHLTGWWHLYYAVSTFGSQTSCIGVTTTRALNPNATGFGWVDRGPVICSNGSAPYNTIDPHVFVDRNTSKVYMNFGSYWQGIFLVELTGAPFYNATTTDKPVHLAYDDDTNRDIEASWVEKSPNGANTWFLFANWGQCCEGVNSTYNIRMARSTTGPKGPYIDQAGVDMVKGGGTLLITTAGRQIGPGQIGFPVGGMGAGGPAPIVSYHYYDRDGTPPGIHTLGEGVFTWGTGSDAWPTITERE